jgi:hypothetical protein
MVPGPRWDPGRDRREQDGWDEHGAFMDDLVADGTVLLGGPYGDGTDVLLAVEAVDEGDLRRRFGLDPWLLDRTIAFGSIQPWSLWLDGRGR